jgi:hypothetical protein
MVADFAAELGMTQAALRAAQARADAACREILLSAVGGAQAGGRGQAPRGGP